MQRRSFLKNSSLAGLTMATGSLISLNEKMTPETDDFTLLETTIDELQQKMKSGVYTSRSITEIYLKRIEAIDKKGPGLNAVMELNPDALKIADEMDRERKSGKVRGPMHGIPVMIKDNIDTADKMMTTAGSLAMVGNRASKDAFVVSRLRAAGAVIIGKTNLSEWANFRSSRSSSGWSSRGGRTQNPYVLNRNPSGSSSGSGAAVSANLCVVAVGTETDGSVIAPSSCSGIVGIKPTVGLISRSGIIPISKTQDTAGPMARTVRDAAILLGVMTGIDSDDVVTKESDGKIQKDYTVYLKPDALKGKRIGIEKRFLSGHLSVVELYKQAIALLKSQGAEVVEIELLKLTSVIGAAEFIVLQYEFKDGLNRYLEKSNAPVKNLAEVIRFNNENAAKSMPWFRQETLESSEQKAGLDTPEYQEALKKTIGCRKIIDDLMAEQKLDAIAGTSIGIPGCTDLINGDYGTGFYFCPPAAMAGYPHITVPMGHVHELPVGLSFIAGAYNEGPLLGIAYAFEQASKKRMSPNFKPFIL
ncbi:MAG: amidase [Chitinophagaceae bacterium]